MKNNKFLKVTCTLFALVLTVGAVFAMSVSAEGETKTPEIVSQNIEYSNEFKIMYAVDASTVAEGAVKLHLYYEEPTESSEPKRTYTVNSATPAAENGNLGKDAYIFTTEGVAYTAMVKNFYVQAEDSLGNKSEVKRYSVAEYFYQRLTDPKATEEQKDLYNTTLEFGTKVQKVISKITDETKLIENLRYVVIDGGKIDGYSSGVYPIGTTLTPVADDPAVEDWTVTTYDKTTNEAVIAEKQKTFVVVDSVKTEFVPTPPFGYRDGANDFDNYVPGVDVPDVGTTNNATKEYVTDDLVHKTVEKLTIPDTSSYVTLPHYGSELTADEATAFEISFDMKFKTPELSEKEYVWFYIAYNNSWKNGFYFYRDENGSVYFLSDDGASYGAYTIPLTTTEWFHIRLVKKAGETGLTVYFNGSDEGYAIDNKTSALANMADFANYKLWFKEYGGSTDIYIDNYFCGYINDAE